MRRYHDWQLYKFAELLRPSVFHPWYLAIQTQNPQSASNLYREYLTKIASSVPFLSEHLEGLHRELPAYFTICDRWKAIPLRASNLHREFWDVISGESSISTWIQVERMVALIPVSTADVERIVSVFADTIGDDQGAALESTLETKTMMRFNHRKPKPRQNRRFYDDGEIVSDEEIEIVDEGFIPRPPLT
jgi:hypothetical protein